MNYQQERFLQKLQGPKLPERKQYSIPKKSAKRAALEKAEKEVHITQSTTGKPREGDLQQWFKDRRKDMTGTCRCGCGNSTTKDDDKKYKHSCCHIFPKAIFKSVAINPVNFIELSFWDGCHTNFDNMGVDQWPNLECWDEIKHKVQQLAPLLTPAERATKFFQQLNYQVCHL